MTEPQVRPARSANLESFVAAFGTGWYFADRLRRQRQRRGVLLLAWLDSHPAGHVYVWLETAEEPPIRQHLSEVALLTHLEVRPELRNRGIGRALVAAAEEYLFGSGHHRVALAVRTDNTAAAHLYRRLDYRDWGHDEVTCYALTVLPDGSFRDEPERCHVLVKDLVPVTPAPPVPPIGAARY
ncbi:GNAT family N-acetyltransferase [Amycolatopsis sp. FBCC-B4732]|uniref:GNAT family N-acetyltransferase n=1 Tax=Amycolatopsis sp. FBCC-B4732 TaxID=3079339 RepID=UPI001FF288C2|nr:GNAT family N-acetyltransferase [Amycolatopsis sp. FBCC-B4732]UOX89646.1 GNAT family N-acetyltransferase [Amycolatopsis sp. FBCC-B4732]